MGGSTGHRARSTSVLAVTGFVAAALGCGGSEAPPVPAASETVEVVDAGDHVVRVRGGARRIVSLVPSATETVVALGAADRLVARTRYDDAPEISHLPSVGGGLDPSIEAVVDLDPDLVLAWNSADDRGLRERLEASGVAVYAVAIHDTSDVVRSIERIGRLIGRSGRADSLVAALRDTLAAVRRDALESSPSVLYLLGGDPPRIAGPRAFVSQLLGVAGGRNAFPDLEARWPAVSVEEILTRDPDVILIPRDEGSPDPAELSRRAGWRDLRAVRDGRLGTLDASLVNRPGPGIGRVARALRDTLDAVVSRARPR